MSNPRLTSADTVVVKDSGQREQMETGSQRDSRTGKGRFDLLPWCVLWRDARLYEAGAKKYDERNWEKGQKSSRYFDSAIRHMAAYMEGDRSEDHLAAARFNIAGIMFNEIMIGRGLLPATLHDIPDYTPLKEESGDSDK